MWYLVILQALVVVFSWDFNESLILFVIHASLNVDFMLSRVFIDFCEHEIFVSFFVWVIQELDPFQNLKTIYGSLLEFVDADGVMRRLVVEANVSSLCVNLALVVTIWV